VIAFVEDKEELLPGPTGIFRQLVRMLLSIDPGDPRSFLEAQIPSLCVLDRAVGASSGIRPAVTGVAGKASALDDPGVDAEVIFSLPPGGKQSPTPVGPDAPPLVVVYHTHALESYLPELSSKAVRPEDAYTADSSLNMTRVGAEMVKALRERGVPALQSTTVHDKDGRLAAYVRSGQTIQALQKQYPSLRVLVDVHRDSQARMQTTVLVRGQYMARIMVVLGKDNEEWRKNYDFASGFIKVLEDKYKGLSLGVYPTPGRFNQHYSPYALLLEMGGVDNNLDEALRSARAAADALAHLLASGAAK